MCTRTRDARDTLALRARYARDTSSNICSRGVQLLNVLKSRWRFLRARGNFLSLRHLQHQVTPLNTNNTMLTDYLLQAPHVDYRATLILTGTRNEFIELRDFLESSELREIRNSKITDDVLEELNDIILYLTQM